MFVKEWKVIDLYSKYNLSRWVVPISLSNSLLRNFRFTITHDDDQAEPKEWGDDTFLFGKDPYTICIFNEETPRARLSSSAPLGGAGGNRVTVRIAGSDRPLEISARVLHEMLHVMGVDSDQMEGKDRDEFLQYLKCRPTILNKKLYEYFSSPSFSHQDWGGIGQMLLMTYYKFLLCKNFKELKFKDICRPVM